MEQRDTAQSDRGGNASLVATCLSVAVVSCVVVFGLFLLSPQNPFAASEPHPCGNEFQTCEPGFISAEDSGPAGS